MTTTTKKTVRLTFRREGEDKDEVVTLTGYQAGFGTSDGVVRIWADRETFGIPIAWLIKIEENPKDK